MLKRLFRSSLYKQPHSIVSVARCPLQCLPAFNKPNTLNNQSLHSIRYKSNSKKSQYRKSQHGMADEDVLITKTDPIAIISLRFNPFVIRAFKEFRDEPTQNNSLISACRLTEDTLLALNKGIKTLSTRSVYNNHISFRHESNRRIVGDRCNSLLIKCQSNKEYKSMAAFMSIMLPKSEQVWLQYDKQIQNMLGNKNISNNDSDNNNRNAMGSETKLREELSLEAGLIGVNAIISAIKEHRFRPSKFRAPHCLLERMLQRKATLLTHENVIDEFERFGLNSMEAGSKKHVRMADSIIDDNLHPGGSSNNHSTTNRNSNSDNNNLNDHTSNHYHDHSTLAVRAPAPLLGATSAGHGNDSPGSINRNNNTAMAAEFFAPLGGATRVRDSPALEILGLLLKLLAFSCPWKRGQGIRNEGERPLMQDVTDYGIKLLSSQKNPVKLHTLKVIWEHAPHVHLPNSYVFYKLLYEQISYSISSEPYQLVREEKSIANLLQSMVQSNFKSTQLITKLFEVTSVQGMDYEQVGIRMFGYLVELDCVPFAMHVLESYLSTVRSGLLYPLRSAEGSSLQLSDKAQNQLFRKLEAIRNQDPTGFELSHLIVMLLCFNQSSKQSPQYRLLESIEQTLLLQGKLNPLSPRNAVGLLYVYAVVGRCYPPILDVINDIISAKVETLPNRQLALAIWACARINNRHEPFIKSAIGRYIRPFLYPSASPSRPAVVSQMGAMNLSKGLWAAAVLQTLDIPTFIRAQEIFENFVSRENGFEMHDFMSNQLNQVYLEAQLIQKQSSSETPLKSPNSIGPLPWQESISRRSSSKQKDLLVADEVEGHDGLENSLPVSDQGQQAQQQHVIDGESQEVEVEMSDAHETTTTTAAAGDSGVPKRRSKRKQKLHVSNGFGSSISHLDASRLLNEMGIYHENEVELDNGYLADIFIPVDVLNTFRTQQHRNNSNDDDVDDIHTAFDWNSMSRDNDATTTSTTISSSSEAEDSEHITHAVDKIHDNRNSDNIHNKGLILEFDGPSHFESYLQQPLGPTLMKHRHIKSAGYLLVSIPFWEYKIDTAEERRRKKLLNYIKESLHG